MNINYASRARLILATQLNATGHSVDDRLLDLYTLLVLVKGADCSLEDVHDAWALWTLPNRPDHKSLVPFDALASDVQDLDLPYAEAIRTAAKA